ncbi:MAG: M15 family metallopeptidase [Gemmatimonadota bacterium]
MPYSRRLAVLALAVAVAACSRKKQPNAPVPEKLDEWTKSLLMEFSREPDSVPTRWRALIGDYGPDTVKRWFVIERDRRLWVMDEHKNYVPLTERSDSVFRAPIAPVPVQGEVRFHLAEAVVQSIEAGGTVMARRRMELASGEVQLKVTPVRPIDEIRREALAATPPAESGSFRPTDLVDVTTLDSTIRLEIRYATENNFLGTKMYDEARAFMQRDAAKALVRANKNAKRVGLGLLIHDAYRPWYVTKIFWDATPEEKKWLVANPATGSRHNRGIAVDITLYDLETKQVVEMPSTYDESTERAFSTYLGGTALQRHHRALLRRLLEHEGFAVNPKEWWHFDYMDRKRYAIGNIAFEDIGR